MSVGQIPRGAPNATGSGTSLQRALSVARGNFQITYGREINQSITCFRGAYSSRDVTIEIWEAP